MNLASVIDTLNTALKLDYEAVKDLIGHRVDCNESLAAHPTIQVVGQRGGYKVGFLGMLNGIIEPLTRCKIAVMIDKESGHITGFQAKPANNFVPKP